MKNKIIYKGTPGYDNSMCLEITQACEKSREGSREELAGKRRDKIINLTYENLPDFKSISSLERIDYENYKINIAQKFREKIKNNFSLIYPIEIFLNAYSSKQGKTRLANFDFSNMPFGTYDLEICAENIFGDVACEAQKEKLEILKERQKNKPEFAFRVISRETVGGTERILLGWESQNISRANVRIFEKNNPAKIIGLFSIEGDLSNQGQEVIYLSKDLRQPYGLTATLQGDFNTIVQEINEGN